MYSPAKNDEAQVSWDPLQLLLEGQGGVKDISPLFLTRKVLYHFRGLSRFVLPPLPCFLSSPFNFQSQSAFHSTEANHPTSFFFFFPSFYPIQTFLLHPNISIFRILP